MNRRRFLQMIGAMTGACALTCAGSVVLLAGKAPPATGLKLAFPNVRFGEDGLKKILIAFASEDGATGGVAETIGATLSESGAVVDVCPVQLVKDLNDYSAVIVGSAIHGGKWLPEAVAFVQTNQEKLQQVPTAFFLVGMMVASRSETNRKFVEQFLAEERAIVNPVAEGRFVGALYPEKFPLGAGLGMRFFLAYCGLGIRGGDFRDPVAIRAWAESIQPKLA